MKIPLKIDFIYSTLIKNKTTKHNLNKMSNYSHILCIKVIDNDSYSVDTSLTETIREQFLKESCNYQNIPVQWHKILPTTHFLDIGNIVTLSPFGEDIYIMYAVRNSINNIQNALNDSGKTILYNIVKPLVTRHVILDSFGVVRADGTIE